MGEGEGGYHRSGATRENLFPYEGKGCLDNIILSKIGMTGERIQTRYALLFNQLLLLMCEVGRSEIRGDPRKSYYCEVEKFSNIYGIQLVIGGTYGHKFVNRFLDKLVWWDGVVQNDVVWGISAEDLY